MSTRRRRFWSEEEKRRIVAQARLSGVSVSQVARRYDVNANLVFKWLRDPRFRPSEDGAGAFLPVEVVPDKMPLCGAGIVAGGGVSSEARIEIDLGNGRLVRARGLFDPDLVVRLVRGLSS